MYLTLIHIYYIILRSKNSLVDRHKNMLLSRADGVHAHSHLVNNIYSEYFIYEVFDMFRYKCP